MAEGGFEAFFHVPHNGRRDKLRAFMAQNSSQHQQPQPFLHHVQSCSGLFPVYDPSICSNSELIPSSETYYNSELSLSAATTKAEGSSKPRTSSMYGLGAMLNAAPSTSSASSPPHYADTHVQILPSILMNPSSVPLNTSSYQYSTQNHLCCSNDVVGFKPEPWYSTGQGLSLSLSSHHGDHQPTQITLPLGLDVRRYCEPAIYDDKPFSWSPGYILGTSTSDDVSKTSGPPGPFTGYAAVLRDSKFLKPAQELLEELHIDICGGDSKSSLDLSLMDAPVEYYPDGIGSMNNHTIGAGKKFNLLSMLEEVCKRYRHYYQQIQSVVTSLECVAGLGGAAPYANLALKTLSKHFRSVKVAIKEQLQAVEKASAQSGLGKEPTMKLVHGERSPSGQRSVQCSGFIEPRPVWRPQRGLPERAVAVLRAWLFEHFLHPYPTDTDKLMLAKQTGLSRNQVSNWFINARVRLWKPMVEEIHTLETRQASKDSPAANLCGGASDRLTAASKSSRNELPDFPGTASEEPPNDSSLPGQLHPGLPTSGRVSLTLGLHQNIGLASSDHTLPVVTARQVGHNGLDAGSHGFVMAGFESQSRSFGRNMIGGQLFG